MMKPNGERQDGLQMNDVHDALGPPVANYSLKTSNGTSNG